MEGLLKPIEELTYDQLRKAYNLHRKQCEAIADRLRTISGEEEIISEFDSDLPKALEGCAHEYVKNETTGRFYCQHCRLIKS